MTVAADVPSSFRSSPKTTTGGSRGNAVEPSAAVADHPGSSVATTEDGVYHPGADGGSSAVAAAWWWPPDWFQHTDHNKDVKLPTGVNARVSDGHKATKIETEDDITSAKSRGDAATAVHEGKLSHPSSVAVRDAMQAAKDLGVDTASHQMNVVTDIQHDIWLSPAAVQIGDTPTMLVPDQNVMKTIADKVSQEAGSEGLHAMGLDGKQYTDALLPEDVALHETEHLRQFAADTNGPGKVVSDTQDAIALSPLEQADRERLHPSELTGAAALTTKLTQSSIAEGMADTVAMTHTQDWKMGEEFFVNGEGAVRDINKTRAQDDFAGAFDNYGPIKDALAGMQAAETTAFSDATEIGKLQAKGSSLSEADRTTLKHLQDDETVQVANYGAASEPIKGDEHLAGTIIPRTFRELQQTAGWDQTRKLADAVGTDPSLWTDADFGKTVDSMRTKAGELDPTGKLREQVDAALKVTHLDDASTTKIAAPKSEPKPKQTASPADPGPAHKPAPQAPHGGGRRMYAA